MSNLCNNYEIIFIQEHWLRYDELSELNFVHPDFIGTGVSAMDPSIGILHGRRYGGVGILWRKSISEHVQIVKYDDVRIIGCQVNHDCGDIIFMNVYLPYQCEENIDDYMLYLGKLSSIINQCNTPTGGGGEGRRLCCGQITWSCSVVGRQRLCLGQATALLCDCIRFSLCVN